MSNIDNSLLLEHHIHFLSKHRGIRESLPGMELIHSSMQFFNIAFRLSNNAPKIIEKKFNIYLPCFLECNRNFMNGRKKSGNLTYMILEPGKNCKTAGNNNNITVIKANTIKEINDFSMAQARGFCETEEEFNEWFPWMKEKNLENMNDENQSFYIAYSDNKPSGVCLVITHCNITGIYAVATIPQLRKQGISTALMKHVIDPAVNSGIETITLQVISGSYAHNFYKNLGFKDVFSCDIYSP